VFPLDSDVSRTGDIIGVLQVDFDLQPGDVEEVTFILAFSPQGEASAVAYYRDLLDPAAALSATETHLQERLGYAQVMTPDSVINNGVLWAKVNMLRVMSDYPQGPAFTNDPSRSSNVVARDACWFIYGCDHLLPDFSRHLLEGMAARQKPDGMIVEYWNAVSGAVDDYGLNINDNTPLFILALNHHWRATGDRVCLERLYDAAARAARYIISQEDERGLVVCTARGTEVYGIASWRNVIQDYQINGAVTEINAECVAALRAMGHLAENLGRHEADYFSAEAKKLKSALNDHLLNPRNGVYYLNIDMDGNIHTDVTADQVFPVVFRVAPDDVAFRIVSRLNSPDFTTNAGIRTVSRASLDYTLDRCAGLLGGVWPGVTWWYAFAAARYHPEFMVSAIRASFQHYNRDPKTNNTVPGQFSEWFDGESLVNRGMRLSPWEPPRFVWAAVEGICGVMLKPGRLTVHPLIPKEWKWVALQRLPFHGSPVTFFAGRWPEGTMWLFTDTEVETEHRVELYEREITAAVQVENRDVNHIVLDRMGEIVVCLGNTFLHTSVVPVRMHKLLTVEGTYVVDMYNSERGAWTSPYGESAANLRNLTISIEAGGYRIIRLRKADDDHGASARSLG
jgi:glycogen debranching enzyme